jgi:hypothetical protein
LIPTTVCLTLFQKRESRRRQPGEGEEGETAEAAPEVNGEASDAAAKPKRRTRKPKEARIDADGEDALVEKPARKPRAPRAPRLELTGEQSQVTPTSTETRLPR